MTHGTTEHNRLTEILSMSYHPNVSGFELMIVRDGER